MSKISKIIMIFLTIIFILVIIFFVVPFIAQKLFDRKVSDEVQELFYEYQDITVHTIQKEEIEDLPFPVQNWINNCGIIDQNHIQSVRLKQSAEMRLKKDQSWLPVEAEQYFTVGDPGFIWNAKIKAAPFVTIVGRDKYFKGKGNMLIKLMSLLTISDSSGKEMDQGTMVRYLAEIVWFPSAALNNNIIWEEINQYKAKATLSYEGMSSSGIFLFNDKGEVINFQTERYKENNGEYTLETWSIDLQEYDEFMDVKIPVQGKVTWKLDEGDFTWFKFEITDIEYNKPYLY